MITEELPEGAIVLEPRSLDVAIVGIDMATERVIYDYDLLVTAFMTDNNWDTETAAEWVNYNVCGAYINNGPIISYKIPQYSDMDELMQLL